MLLEFGLPGNEGPFEPIKDARDVAVGGTGRIRQGVADIVESNAGLGHPADPQQPDHLVVAIAAAVVAPPLGLRDQADLVVVTDRSRRGADERRGTPDRDLARRGERREHVRAFLIGRNTLTAPHDPTEGATPYLISRVGQHRTEV